MFILQQKSIFGRTISEWRHIAYRIKYKYLLSTSYYRWIIGKIWPEPDDTQVKIVWHKDVDAFKDVNCDGISSPFARHSFKSSMEKWSRHAEEVICVDSEVILEPRYSLGILPDRSIIAQTRGQSHFELRPAFSTLISNKKITRSFPKIVHLDGFVGKNLFHFIYEGINSIAVLHESGYLDRNVPMLINRRVHDTAFARTILTFPGFEELEVVVHENDDLIKANTLIKASPSFEHFRSTYEIFARVVQKRPSRRIFLDRRPRFQRRLLNHDEIEDLLRLNGFDTIYCEDLPYMDQATLFSSASHVVGLHGAGMTNLLFCDLPNTRVLEVTSQSLPNPCFFWLSTLLNVDYYDVVVGSKFDADWNYKVSLADFRASLRNLLS